MYVRPVPVLTSRMKHMEKAGQGYDAGIPVDFRILLSILRDITRAMFSRQDGDSGSCISFRTCRSDCQFMAALAVAVVPGHVLLI